MSELESKPGLLDCKTRIPNCQTSLTDTLSHVWGEEILAHFRWKESGRRQVYKVDVGWEQQGWGMRVSCRESEAQGACAVQRWILGGLCNLFIWYAWICLTLRIYSFLPWQHIKRQSQIKTHSTKGTRLALARPWFITGSLRTCGPNKRERADELEQWTC